MESKKSWLGMLALVLALGMTVVGCDNNTGDNTSDENGCGKSITITGIGGKTGTVLIALLSSVGDGGDGTVAMGTGSISGGSVTMSLVKDQSMTPWTGSGSYYLWLNIKESSTNYYYYYTNGQTLDFDALPKYNISSEKSTIAFNLFKEAQ